MDCHYCQHDYRYDEDMEGVESNRKVVEAKTEYYSGEVRPYYWTVKGESLSNVDGELSSNVEDQVVTGVGFDHGDDAEDNSCHPEDLVSELVSSPKILVEHVHYRQENHRVGGVVVDVPDDRSPGHIAIDRLDAVVGLIA